jgi:ERCC4-type nuclease
MARNNNTNSRTQCLIDYREAALLKAVEDAESKNLEIGDVQFICDGEIRIIIERKKVADLAQSIKDNRYKEQKARQLAYRSEHPNAKIVYVIEGYYMFDPVMVYNGMNNNTLTSSIINTMLRDNINVIMTKNIKDTCHFVSSLKKRFDQDPAKYNTTWEGGQIDGDTYAQCVASGVKTKKKENIDEQTCFLMQLSCIPGISAKKATDITTHLQAKNMYELIAALQEDGVNTLTGIPGIGKVLASTVMTYIFGDDEKETLPQ